mmetsp:Transcript_32687/g.87773  ORF Transcript_32687/g.87773 Transcript_32687/m.87773 type:complete len:201 (+) Transcript_32687:229-831(+)
MWALVHLRLSSLVQQGCSPWCSPCPPPSEHDPCQEQVGNPWQAAVENLCVEILCPCPCQNLLVWAACLCQVVLCPSLVHLSHSLPVTQWKWKASWNVVRLRDSLGLWRAPGSARPVLQIVSRSPSGKQVTLPPTRASTSTRPQFPSLLPAVLLQVLQKRRVTSPPPRRSRTNPEAEPGAQRLSRALREARSERRRARNHL